MMFKKEMQELMKLIYKFCFVHEKTTTTTTNVYIDFVSKSDYSRLRFIKLKIGRFKVECFAGLRLAS